MEERFKPARVYFEHVLTQYPNGSYAEDAAYRVGGCWFGLLDYRRSRAKLEGGLADYPDSRLVSEAQALLGDLAAAEGRTEAAINAYGAAHDAGALLDPPNMGYINHAVFQAGKVLAAEQRWPEMTEWFETYLRHWGSAGRAQVAMGRNEAMLDVWIAAILRFGNDLSDTGPDLMLAEFPEHYRAERGESPERVWRDALAVADGARTDHAHVAVGNGPTGGGGRKTPGGRRSDRKRSMRRVVRCCWRRRRLGRAIRRSWRWRRRSEPWHERPGLRTDRRRGAWWRCCAPERRTGSGRLRSGAGWRRIFQRRRRRDCEKAICNGSGARTAMRLRRIVKY